MQAIEVNEKYMSGKPIYLGPGMFGMIYSVPSRSRRDSTEIIITACRGQAIGIFTPSFSMPLTLHTLESAFQLLLSVFY